MVHVERHWHGGVRTTRAQMRPVARFGGLYAYAALTGQGAKLRLLPITPSFDTERKPTLSENPSDPSSRLDEMEMRIAHQDKIIAELNAVVTAQWRQIDVLERRVAELSEEFKTFVPPRTTPEPPPPHY